MCRLTVLAFTPLLWCSFATSTIIASVGTTTSSYDVNTRLQKSPTVFGIITTVAGSRNFNGSVNATTNREVSYPRGLAFDNDGNLYIVAKGRHKILKVTVSSGIITTVAGSGVQGYGGDGGQATSAFLLGPVSVTLDTTGNIFIADTYNNRIRKVTMSTGLITTVAGNGENFYSEDNVSATSTSLYRPNDVAVDPSGNIFIADSDNSRIRKVSAATGMMTTIAGDGDCLRPWKWSSGGSAIGFCLFRPTGVTLDTLGNIYIADEDRNCIFKITVSSGSMSTVAGNPQQYSGRYNGDDILATKSELHRPKKVAFDASGNMYISDSGNNRIRKVTASTGMISTVAGTGDFRGSLNGPYSGEGGLATAAEIYYPVGVAVDTAGNLYFTDNDVVRKVTFTEATPSTSVTSAPSRAPAAPSSTATQSSSTTHFAQTLHLTIILLSSLLVLHLYRDA